jgi:predicted ATPase
VRITKIRLENFRAFTDETFSVRPYTCLVGANGAGKSTVLAALNVFFRQNPTPGQEPITLGREDFHDADMSAPIRITLFFGDLSDNAKTALGDYVRHDELIVTAEVTGDSATGVASLRHYGQRLGLDAFREYFGREHGAASAAELKDIFDALRAVYPDVRTATTKDARTAALREFEAAHVDDCVPIPSPDNFYGSNSTGKLAAFVQWVYVPAVKDVAEEGLESRASALGKLIRRTVDLRTDVDEQIAALTAETVDQYQGLLDANRGALLAIGQSLQARLAEWAHPDVNLSLDWVQDARGAVRIVDPVAGVRLGEGSFMASLSHMGHGMQRSYLLAILQELAASGAPGAPTLILGCEEPELYQHPPQARYLAEIFQELVAGNNQIIATSHSPVFASGPGFEDVRVVQRSDQGPKVTGTTYEDLCARIRAAGGDDPDRPIEGLRAKIQQAMQPAIAEMLFCQVPVLVEGLEDAAYLTIQLHLSGLWDEFRRLGCHIVAVGGKSRLIQPLAIARCVGLPAFVIFDADGDETRPDRRIRHERDNATLVSLSGIVAPAFPADTVLDRGIAIWPDNLTEVVRRDLGESGAALRERTRLDYASEGDLEKNWFFLSDWLGSAANAGLTSTSLVAVSERIIAHAARVRAGTLTDVRELARP